MRKLLLPCLPFAKDAKVAGVMRRAGVSLTQQGRRFLPAARQLLEVAEQALASARGGADPPLRVDVWGPLR